MPNYDFRCPNGHVTEKFIPLTEWQENLTITCECSELAEQVVLPRRATTTISPFVYYLTPTGEIRIPGRSDGPVPKGLTRCEATTFHEVQQLEQRMSREEQAKLRESVELRDYYHELDHQSDRADMRHYLASGKVPEIDQELSQKRGEVVYTGRMVDISPQGRDMMLQAIERSNKRRNFSAQDLGYHFHILHNFEG